MNIKDKFLDIVKNKGIKLHDYELDFFSQNSQDVNIENIDELIRTFFDKCSIKYFDSKQIEEIVKELKSKLSENVRDLKEEVSFRDRRTMPDNGGFSYDTFKKSYDKCDINIEVGVCSLTNKNIVIVSIDDKTENIIYCNSENEAKMLAQKYSHKLNAN